jgi:parvulin-like peptidyl-prolyl isomerase
LDDLIRDELIVQEAKKLRITTDKKKVDAEMARQRGLFPSDDKFQDALRQRGLTLERFRQRIERAFVIQEVLNREVNQKVTVTDEEMAAYFRQHPEKFIMPEQHRLRLLFLSVDAAALPAEWERTRQRAAELRARAVRGEDFGALVRQSSDDPETRDRGGDTGLIHHGQLGVVEIERAVETLKPGELTEPIRTIYGVYLARVEEKRPGRQQTFEEVNKELFRQELLEAGRRQRHQEWIRGLIAQAKVTRLPAPAPAP